MMITKLKSLVRSQRQKLLRTVLYLFSSRLEVTGKKTLIIAPHPDDETFGCGGLIIQKIQKDVEVYVLFLTKGEKSLEGVLDQEVKKMRQKNATEALTFLGVDENHLLWLDLPDGEVPRKESKDFYVAKNRVSDMMNSLKIEEVYSTHYLEGWSDHLAAYELTMEAVKALNQEIDVYLYWVWVWYYVGVKQMFSLSLNKTYLLTIASVFKQKQQALNVYFDNKTDNGELYMGKLPKVFLKAFEWPYEVYEKVNIDEF